MSLINTLPDEIGRQLKRLLAEEESLLLSTASDVTPEGDYGEEWLVATAARLRVFSRQGESYHCRLDLPVEGLSDAKAILTSPR